MKVRLGPVTILGLMQTADGRLKLIAAEGSPSQVQPFASATRTRGSASRPAPARSCSEGPTHHVALGVGHEPSRVRNVADLLGLELAVVD
jgi:L-arabinose isomerase